MTTARHLQTGGRHEKRYTGWNVPTQPIYSTAPLDEADQLALNQELPDRTPPQPWIPPQVQVPAFAPQSKTTIPPYLRWVIAGLCAMAGGFVVLIAVLALALYLDPGPAQANNDLPKVHQTVKIKDGRISIPNGTYTIERTKP